MHADAQHNLQALNCGMTEQADLAWMTERDRIAGILYTSLHEAPESHDMLLAATSDPLATLWNAMETGSCATQTIITGAKTLAHGGSLKYRCHLADGND